MSTKEQDIQQYLDTATFAINRAIGLAMSRIDGTIKPMLMVQSLQKARDIMVETHDQLN